MIDTFLPWDYKQCQESQSRRKIACLTEWPALRAISFKFEKTKGTVRGFGLNSVFCIFLEFFGRVSLDVSYSKAESVTCHCH
jgi:hypothetical protein